MKRSGARDSVKISLNQACAAAFTNGLGEDGGAHGVAGIGEALSARAFLHVGGRLLDTNEGRSDVRGESVINGDDVVRRKVAVVMVVMHVVGDGHVVVMGHEGTGHDHVVLLMLLLVAANAIVLELVLVEVVEVVSRGDSFGDGRGGDPKSASGGIELKGRVGTG